MRTVLLAAVFLAAAACAPRWVLGPGADEIRADGQAASTRGEGIALLARLEAWQGAELPAHTLPVFIEITNRSAVPVRVRYDRFELLSDDRRSYAARLPFANEAQATALARSPCFRAVGFTYAPYLSPHFGGLPLPGNGAFPPDAACKALPEGVLRPGGAVRGFLYFESPSGKESRVRLLADFDNPETGKRVIRLGIPFVSTARH